MEVTNFKVYDLNESIVASGLPMKSSYDAEDFAESAKEALHGSPHFDRMVKLASAPAGSGHANALSGILVSANITATVKWWEQFQRYHFKQIVSSMSTIHRLPDMLKKGTIQFHPKTDKRGIALLHTLIEEGADLETLAYTCPMGILLTARVTMNYLQLKTMYQQRKAHKLEEWHQFCNWITKLPYATTLITEGEN